MNYKAVKRQHVLPKASIERYYSEKQYVYVMLMKKDNRIFEANANNSLFVADRKWDERAEKCVNVIETDFQILSEKVIQGKILNAADFETANIFYALLSERSKARYHEFEKNDSLFDRSTINYIDMSESEQDRNERDGVIFLRSENDNIIDRSVRGMAVLQSIQRASKSGNKWGIVKTYKEFIVSDIYHFYAAIPVAPTIYLVRDKPNINLDETETVKFNRAIKEKSQKFIFSSCRETLNY